MLDVTDSWVLKPLGELTHNFDSQRIPVKEADRRQGPYPYYGASGIVDYVDNFIFDGEYLLIAEDGENLRTRNTPIAFLANGKYWVNNHAHIVRGNELADTRFLLYAILNADIGAYLTGSTMPKLTQGNLNRLQILTPSLCEQRAIAATLSALDDKIEINNCINKTLEEMAQALFKHWFVDFEFPDENGQPYKSSGGEMEESELGPTPKGWKVGTISDLCTVGAGKRPRVRQNSWSQECRYPIIGASSIMGYNDEYFLDGPIIVTGRVGTHGIVSRFDGKTWPSDNTLVITSEFYQFSYQNMLLIDYKSLNRGSTQPLITQSDIKNQPVLLPLSKYINEYELIADSIFEKQRAVQFENEKLSSLRDTLLPKLMSGEIRVPFEEMSTDV